MGRSRRFPRSISRACLLALAALGTAPAAAALAQEPSPFGLRNAIELLDGWEASDFAAEFDDHEAGHLAFWTFWGDFQPEAPPATPCGTPYCFDVLDRGLDFATALDVDPVIVFHLDKTPGASGAFWGMSFNAQNGTGPVDLVVPSGGPVACPETEPEDAYSHLLYDVAFAIAERIALSDVEGTVWMRFHNESWDLWPIGTGTAQQDSNLYRYLLSYLSFRQGILDGEAFVGNPEIALKVSHGSIPSERMTVRERYAEGVADPEERAEIIAQFDSYIERSRCKVGTSGPAFITTWTNATAYANPSTSKNQRFDRWLDSFIEWTALCRDANDRRVFEFTTFHPHGKPALVHYDRFYYDREVQAVMDANSVAGGPPEWVGAEVAFGLPDHVNWGVHPLGDDLDRFIAEDLGRKWCTLLANAELFCSPVIGGGTNFRGLYRADGSLQPETGCGEPDEFDEAICPCELCPTPVICPDPANAAFLYLSGLIGRPDDVDVLKTPDNARSHYRYYLPNGVVDALWRNALEDGDTDTSNYTVSVPFGYVCGDTYDVFGTQVGTVQMSLSGGTVTNVGQAPRIIVWKCKLQEH